MITQFFKPKKKVTRPGPKRAREEVAEGEDVVASPATNLAIFTPSSAASEDDRLSSARKRSKTSKPLDPVAEELLRPLPVDSPWRTELHGKVWASPSFTRLAKFVKKEQNQHTVYPPPSEIFTALNVCPLDQVKVVIVGQDPYHGPNQAHGLCFSVLRENPIPPSLRNIYKELSDDIEGFQVPRHGHLIRWAKQGVLLLNTVWTVRRGQAHSHKNQGWENVTSQVLQALRDRPCVFLLWGKPATQCVERALPVRPKHHVRIASSHPSPLGATKTKAPFIGSRCFSQCNDALKNLGYTIIDWAVDGPLPKSAEDQEKKKPSSSDKVQEEVFGMKQAPEPVPMPLEQKAAAGDKLEKLTPDPRKDTTTPTATSHALKISEQPEATPVPQPLSKSQLKKQQRLAHKAEVNRRRKQQEREAKEARAKAQGRDLEQERAEQELRRGTSKAKRDARWVERLQASQSRFQVALDCSFQDAMSTKEIKSLALQLRYCYACNRRTDVPCLLKATSVSGATLECLQKVSGFEEWKSRGFVVTDQALTDVYADRMNAADLVYLTSDSENILQDLDDSKIYVIGGIVDRNRLKRATYTRAQSLQIATAKLPIDEYLAQMHTTRVLTCNHVFDILMRYREHRDWQKAFLSVLPQRKGATTAATADVGCTAVSEEPVGA